jgi:dolichyl-phosphate beta-glucosyltransferase
MQISVVIPAFNEERRIASAIDAVTAEAEALGHGFEVICVDDGSSDATAGVVAQRALLDPRVRLLRMPVHRGKGAAVRAGVLDASGDLIFCLDADLSAPPQAIAAALPLLGRDADVVRGSRHCPGAKVLRRQGVLRRSLGRVFTALARNCADPEATDLTCGFKGYRRDAARAIFGHCRLAGWAFDAESAWVARRLGCRTREIPVQWTNDPDSRVRLPAALLESGAGLLWLWLRSLRARVLRTDPQEA